MNKYIKSLLAVALLSLVTISAQAGVKIIKTLPNGDQIVRIKTVGVFVPSTTTILKLTKAGELLPLNAAASSGVFGQAAAPAATASAAYLHRPDNTKVNVNGGNANAGAVNAPSTTVNGGPTTLNNSTTVNDAGSHNHHNGN